MSTNIQEQFPYLDKFGKLTKEAETALAEPFEVNEIKWKPQMVKKGKDGSSDTATVIAYADSRVYHERLDQVFGPGNWSSSLSMASSPYRAEKTDWKTKEVTVKEGHKIYMIASVSINGLGTKTSSGDCETDNDNAVTVAEAQAFKRACSMVGIGRYLYFLPKYEGFEVSYGKLKKFPTLPDSAIPKPKCESCKKPIDPFSYEKNGSTVTLSPADVVQMTKTQYGAALCRACSSEKKASQKKESQSVTNSNKKQEVA